jgi:hypothetical protein
MPAEVSTGSRSNFETFWSTSAGFKSDALLACKKHTTAGISFLSRPECVTANIFAVHVAFKLPLSIVSGTCTCPTDDAVCGGGLTKDGVNDVSTKTERGGGHFLHSAGCNIQVNVRTHVMNVNFERLPPPLTTYLADSKAHRESDAGRAATRSSNGPSPSNSTCKRRSDKE